MSLKKRLDLVELPFASDEGRPRQWCPMSDLHATGRQRLDPEIGQGASDRAEHRRVPAGRDVDDDRIALPLRGVVILQLRAQAPRLHPDDRVRARIEGLAASEYFNPDGVFLQRISGTVQGVLDDVPEKTAEHRSSSKRVAPENFCQLLPGGSSRGARSVRVAEPMRGVVSHGVEPRSAGVQHTPPPGDGNAPQSHAIADRSPRAAASQL